ncbi:porin [Paraburkholderia silviterrae]|uniref:Porin n=1 Tax=Paraburkholderia silviterrae TaxID=2528715 RepID=A0A4R5M6Q8_9BURK|nr:porin [Paraburkholderia silviterrae]TDG21307.1 porin [Paraburkholderia silviterrae]
MKKLVKSVALGALGAMGVGAMQGAWAQSSVTLYGIVDAGLSYVTNAAKTNGKNRDVAAMMSGGEAADRFGFRGVEDLGGGLKAVFQLENGFNLANGGVQQNGRLFGRQAFVGLSSPYGTLMLGRQRVPIYDLFTPLDPLGYFGWSIVSQDAQYAGRADNAAKYVADLGRFRVDAMYSTGYDSTIVNGAQVPGEFRVGQEISVGASYSAGPLAAAAAYDLRRGTSEATQSAKEQRFVIGATYQIVAALKAYAGYKWFNSSVPASAARSDMYYGGLQLQCSPAFFISAATYYTDIKSAGQHPVDFGLNTQYLLSKSTSLYGEVNYVKNNHGSNLGVAGYGVGVVAGANQTGVAVGIIHFF